MKLQTNDTWNTQVVWDKSGLQIVPYEVISCKMELSWLHENQIACNEWQKSEISEKLKEDIILNLFKWLKKPCKLRFVKMKKFIIECCVRHCFRNSHLEVLRNKNAARLIRKFMRKHHAEKWKLFLKSRKSCFFF